MYRSDRVVGNAVGVVGMVIWAANFPLAEAILKTWHPLLIAPLRFGLAGITIMAVAAALGQLGHCRGLIGDRRFVLASTALGVAGVFFVYGQSAIDPVAAAVVVSSMPLISALFGWLDGSERLGLRLLVAIALTIVGGVVTSTAGEAGPAGDGSIAGALMMLAAVTLYTAYTRMMVGRFAATPDMLKTGLSMLLSLPPILAATLAAWVVGASLSYELSGMSVAMIAFLGCVTVGATAVMWLWTGRKIGVTVAAMHHNLVPFYVIVLSQMAGGTVTTRHVLGAVLVILGAVLAQLPSGRRASADAGA